MRRGYAWLLVLVLAAPGFGESPEAISVLQQFLGTGNCQMHIGEQLRIDPGLQELGGRIESWRQAGLITVTSEHEEGWLARNQEGREVVVNVAPTEKGLSVADLTDNGLEGVCFRTRVKKLVSDKEITSGLDRYRAVQALVDQKPTELGQLLDFEEGERAVRVLVRWNGFKEEWELLALDFGSPDGRFSSQRVPEALEKL